MPIEIEGGIEMEFVLDGPKQLPLILLGKHFPFLTSYPHLDSAQALGEEKNSHYFLLHFEEEGATESALEILASQAIPADQIIVLLTKDKNLNIPADVGILELHPSDSSEDFRQRLHTRLETQKQRRLKIEKARYKNVLDQLPAEEIIRREEIAHVTHSFCCSLNLEIIQHRNCLQTALTNSQWNTGFEGFSPSTPERLLPICAALALKHHENPMQFREEYRRISVSLPFRTRTDLRNLVERCMEGIWKGRAHAA